MNNQLVKIAFAFLAVFIFFSSVFIVDQRQQAIVLQFGLLNKVHDTPGLKFKLPFIQNVIFYEKRVLGYDVEAIKVTTSDQKRLVVDTYSRYRIANPLLFFQSVTPANEFGAKNRLEPIVSSSVRNIMGKVTLPDVLNKNRAEVMNKIEQEIKRLATPLGLEIVDVRVTKTELPPENRASVFARMNSELIRFAKENRAKGAEAAQVIRATADTEKTVILATARKEAQELKGQGDRDAIQITNKSYGKDPKFYSFYRTLEAYRKTLAKGDTKMILSTDNELLKLFKEQPSN